MVRMPLLTTKLQVSPLRPNLVPRPRLMQRLNEGLCLRRRLTLVCAPAGFGKTTLISEWLQRGDRPYTWLSLDDGDNDPARFLAYLATALQEVHDEWGRVVQRDLQSPQPPLRALLADLINQVAAGSIEFVLVLDDYHIITAQTVHGVIAFLLDNMPPQMHLALLTRADPPLSVPRLRARGELTEIRADDLRFSVDDATVFLEQIMGLKLSPEQTTALVARTEGWAAGLQLAALSLQGVQHNEEVAGFVQAFAGSHRYVMDYLIEEVFDRQPSDVQGFLLQTSVLDRLSGPLCDAVTGQENGQQMLERLERANLFTVALDQDRHWYRYHRLFADLLQDRLKKTAPSRIRTLHIRASQWYESENIIDQAVSHALAGGELMQVARLVEENAGSKMWQGEVTTVLGWIEALPKAMVRTRPKLCLDYAWALLLTGREGAAEPWIRDAENALASIQDSAEKLDIERETPAPLGEADLMRIVFPQAGEDHWAAIELSQRALEHVKGNNWFARGLILLKLGIAYRRIGKMAEAGAALAEAVRISEQAGNTLVVMVATYNLARLYGLMGKLDRAAETCRRALRVVHQDARIGPRHSPGLAMAYLGLADVLHERNELAEAEQHVMQAIALGEPGGYQSVLMNGYTLLARLRQARSDGRGALAAIQKLEETLQSRHSQQTSKDEAAVYWAGICLSQGNLEPAGRWADGIEITADDHLDTLEEFKALTLVRVLLAQGRLDEAEPLIERLLHAAESEGRRGKMVEILALQALGQQARGNTTGALEVLRRALELAEPQGFVRTFVDEGAPMATLLRRALACGIAPGYVVRLLAAFGPSAPTQSLAEPLTRREQEVLRLIAAGMRNKEIADKLVISVATVKRHITTIYGKLGVSHRTQAVSRAREIGLV